MIINESAGSGGDALPYYFQLRKIGPLVGTRTWGGLVGTLGVPPTIDGGGITAPGLAFYNLAGKWAVENEGIAPDVEVEYTASDVIKGHDPQLERAVQEAMKLLDRDALKRVAAPAAHRPHDEATVIGSPVVARRPNREGDNRIDFRDAHSRAALTRRIARCRSRRGREWRRRRLHGSVALQRARRGRAAHPG